ncbi:hypothetical protein MLD38_016561 [Melastoma candidum]|uniref:Uncharacterized protein n=1 Tax=Melastoma candidum TaxID=119954 RepID=A0ACB9QNC5_9MYRT|nr:hypothetical protein MLD38_016561 [Melastoma candidum]
MESYKRWVRRNRDYVHSFDSLANGLTWLLPERFSHSEIGPEAVTAILGVITSVNQHIIDTAPSPTQLNGAHPETNSFPYSLCISALKDIETLVEVAAQHFYGEERKWDFMAATETMKFLVRLAMFRNSGYKMILQGGVVPNVDEHSEVSTSQSRSGNVGKFGSYNGPDSVRNGFRQTRMNSEGRALSALSQFGEHARMVSDPVWLQRMQYQRAIIQANEKSAEKPTLSSILSEKGIRGALFVFGELIFLARPVLYVLLVRKYGIRSWKPWIVSLGLDLVGAGILSPASLCTWGSREQNLSSSKLECDELKRRKLLWALYVMRDPFFTTYTRQRLESAEKATEPVPIFGTITAKLIELIVGAQTRYTYMSGS